MIALATNMLKKAVQNQFQNSFSIAVAVANGPNLADKQYYLVVLNLILCNILMICL